MIPVTRGLPQRTGQDNGRLNLLVAIGVLHLLPVLHKSIAHAHTIGKPEGKTRTRLGHHKQVHLATNLAVVTLLCLGEKFLILGKLFFGAERYTIDARKHLVVLIALPVCTRHTRKLKRLESLGIHNVRANAHVYVLTLLVKGNTSVLGQIIYVLYLVRLATLLHVSNGLLAGQLVGFKLEVFLADLAHLIFNSRKIILRNLYALRQINIVIKAIIRSRTIAKLCLRIQTLYCHSQNMRSRVTQNLQLFILANLCYVTVVKQCLHEYVLLISMIFSNSHQRKTKRSTQTRKSKIGRLSRAHTAL